jgi:hypothetical protein
MKSPQCADECVSPRGIPPHGMFWARWDRLGHAGRNSHGHCRRYNNTLPIARAQRPSRILRPSRKRHSTPFECTSAPHYLYTSTLLLTMRAPFGRCRLLSKRYTAENGTNGPELCRHTDTKTNTNKLSSTPWIGNNRTCPNCRRQTTFRETQDCNNNTSEVHSSRARDKHKRHASFAMGF